MNKRLLIVEDDDNLMDLMLDYCEELNVTAIPAVDGTSALAKALAEKPDAATVDYRLPDMSGMDVIHRLKKDPATAAIPLFLLSADAKLHETEAKKAGAAGVLLKPVSPDGLRAALNGCWGNE
ncbi:MAG: response regulator [Elusimicrobia bacterium]|nr:response regulator [Elusimicrobiota bacterium]